MIQASKRDYEKVRSQLESARRKTIGANSGTLLHESHSNNAFLNNVNQERTSAPQPFYSGVCMCLYISDTRMGWCTSFFCSVSSLQQRSMNSPVPFLGSQNENKQQANLWQYQLEHQSPSPPSLLQKTHANHQAQAGGIYRRSTTPMPPSRLEVEKTQMRPPNAAHLKIPSTTAGRGLSVSVKESDWNVTAMQKTQLSCFAHRYLSQPLAFAHATK
jgi:hypothetical protein